MFDLIKTIVIRLLSGLVNAFNHTKCVSLSNQKCITQPILINLYANEWIQEFHYYPFAIKLEICLGNCNTLNNLSNKGSGPNKLEDLNISVFNMIAGINELKKLTQHISCECKYRFDKGKCNSKQNGYNAKC